jgi:hypothetical protein
VHGAGDLVERVLVLLDVRPRQAGDAAVAERLRLEPTCSSSTSAPRPMNSVRNAIVTRRVRRAEAQVDPDLVPDGGAKVDAVEATLHAEGIPADDDADGALRTEAGSTRARAPRRRGRCRRW